MRKGSLPVMFARTAAAAAALNVVFPGAGHLYLGRFARFAIPAALFAATLMALGWLGLISTLPGFIAIMTFSAGVFLFAIVDAAVLGARLGRTTRKWYSRWFVLVAWIGVLAVLGSLWEATRESALGYAVYRVPGVSMRPTLAPGDIILVDTRIPANQELAPGTLVVFRQPRSGALAILRIKEATGQDTFSLGNGLPMSWTVDAIPRANITGLVTALLWSPEKRELARPLPRPQ